MAQVDSLEQDSVIPLGDGQFVWQNKIYKENSNYLTFGYGPAFNPKRKAFEQSFGVAYNFSVKEIALQGGFHQSSDDWLLNRSTLKLLDYRIGGGKRWETLKSNMAVYAGPTLSVGASEVILDDTTKERTGFTKFGLYAEFQCIYKVFYDVGFGATAFFSLNEKYQVFGIRLEFYFSPAYRRPFN